MKLTIGCDPEFFLFDSKNDMYISAHGLVPGSKKEPYKLPNGGAVQLDGTAVEFNIIPAETPEMFNDNILSTLNDIREMIPKRYKFRFEPAVIYDKKYYDTVVPQDCKEIGCDPDYDSVTFGTVNTPPAPQGSMRTGAGHIHIGWTKDRDFKTDMSHRLDCIHLNNAITNWVIRNKRHWDKDTLREKMYGYNGAFRYKPYGLEHRVLSNAWVKYPRLHNHLFNVMVNIFEWMELYNEQPVFDAIRNQPIPYPLKEIHL